MCPRYERRSRSFVAGFILLRDLLSILISPSSFSLVQRTMPSKTQHEFEKEVLASSSATMAHSTDAVRAAEPRISISSASTSSSESSAVPLPSHHLQLRPSLGSLNPEGDADQLSRQSSRADGERLGRLPTGRSVATNMTSDPEYEVDFAEDDPGNPRNWSMWKKSTIIFFFAYTTMTVYVFAFPSRFRHVSQDSI